MNPHPAKTVLLTTGGLTLIQGVFAVPTGLFVGPHILAAAILMLVSGATAIWLGCRRYDAINRFATIGCAVLLILTIGVEILVEPPAWNDIAGVIFPGILLLVTGAVLLVTIRTPT